MGNFLTSVIASNKDQLESEEGQPEIKVVLDVNVSKNENIQQADDAFSKEGNIDGKNTVNTSEIAISNIYNLETFGIGTNSEEFAFDVSKLTNIKIETEECESEVASSQWMVLQKEINTDTGEKIVFENECDANNNGSAVNNVINYLEDAGVTVEPLSSHICETLTKKKNRRNRNRKRKSPNKYQQISNKQVPIPIEEISTPKKWRF